MQKIKTKETIQGTIPILFMREKESFIAFSPALDLSTCGKSLEEAKKNFIEALEIFFEECISMGTLAEVLESNGWVRDRKKSWKPPLIVGEERIEIPNMVTV